MAAHHIPYAAQASIGNWRDLTKKAEKAFAVDGPAFLAVLAPCPRGWRIPSNMTIEIARLAVETGAWPLFEIENGEWSMTPVRGERKPLVDYLKPQGRFKHLFKPGNEDLLEQLQEECDEYYNFVLRQSSLYE